jgi:hypothetical protein
MPPQDPRVALTPGIPKFGVEEICHEFIQCASVISRQASIARDEYDVHNLFQVFREHMDGLYDARDKVIFSVEDMQNLRGLYGFVKRMVKQFGDVEQGALLMKVDVFEAVLNDACDTGLESLESAVIAPCPDYESTRLDLPAYNYGLADDVLHMEFSGLWYDESVLDFPETSNG